VRQWQELFFENRLSGVDLTGNPNFVLMAEAHGGVGLRCTEADEVRKTLQQALDVTDKPVFMDFLVSKEENVFPFIPAGKSVDDIMLHQLKDDN
jgi:acetolactate synthase I/II/III large subunit